MVNFKVVDVREMGEFRNYGSKDVKEPYLIVVEVDGMALYPRDENGQQPTFATVEEAEEFIDPATFRMPDAWAVMKNADFTEGRGPMLLDKVFYKLENAHMHIMSNVGIYGSGQYIQTSAGINMSGEAYAYTYYNGYELKPIYIN